MREKEGLERERKRERCGERERGRLTNRDRNRDIKIERQVQSVLLQRCHGSIDLDGKKREVSIDKGRHRGLHGVITEVRPLTRGRRKTAYGRDSQREGVASSELSVRPLGSLISLFR